MYDIHKCILSKTEEFFAQRRPTVSSAESKILGTKALKMIARWKQLRPYRLSNKKVADIDVE
jgi:hypothetical protein